jgi:hypothetical protein
MQQFIGSHSRSIRHWCGLGLIAAAVFGLLLAPGTPPAAAATLTLYDGAQGGTPDTQDYFTYLTNPLPPQSSASQSFANGATTLTTTLQISDQAGYFAFSLPTLDRTAGYTVRFIVQVLEETHSNNHRAGFSVIVLSKDLKGIELGFWKNQVWAQSGADFQHAEGVALDTTTGLIAYQLAIHGSTYTLTGGGATLNGLLRDYSASMTFPYSTPNFLFLGDDTTSASTRIKLSRVDLVTTEPPTATATSTARSLFMPLIARPTAGVAR